MHRQDSHLGAWGVVIAPAYNQRWASDGFAISCWNGEVVRTAFAIGTYDREIMAWVATSGGSITGEAYQSVRFRSTDFVQVEFEPKQVQTALKPAFYLGF